jgi:hypothetical protein
MRRGLVAVVAGTGLVLGAAAGCNDSGPGVPDSGEQGDPDGFGTGGDQGSTEDGEGKPGEGAAGDEVGGGG